MKITFVGVGSAFTTAEYYQSNIIVTADNGKHMLVDCGTDIRFSLKELKSASKRIQQEIDTVYISHLHSDHIGGIEWLGFETYFDPSRKGKRPVLYMEQDLMVEMWNCSLKGGLGCIEGKMMNLTDFFECRGLEKNGYFDWEGIRFTLHQMPHIMTGYRNLYSYGLLIEELKPGGSVVFFTTDTQFQPELMQKISEKASLIFHDTETNESTSVVHTHYNELMTLPEHIRNKMWLYHYQPHPRQKPEDDGFLGFVSKGQVFRF